MSALVDTPLQAYTIAFLDWLGCVVGGRDQPAVSAARTTGDLVLLLGTAGHVLDYDDTYSPGLSHLSAPTAPAALAIAAERGASIGDALAAYAAGFEAMGAVARASHPGLYERGWHPTAVCGVVGATVAAAQLLGADRERAVAIALLRAGGLRAAFGSDGKALQVGMSASTGVLAARLAEGGADVPLSEAAHGPAGFEATFGGCFVEAGRDRAIDQNWIKAWPCCLQTHGAIEAAERIRGAGLGPDDAVEVAVHPVSLQAAAYGPEPANGLQAKFSIPYLVALTLLHGPPRVESFGEIDPRAARFAAERVRVRADPTLAESEAVLVTGSEHVRVQAARGSPARPMSAAALDAKLHDLADTRLDGALAEHHQPARELLALCGMA